MISNSGTFRDRMAGIKIPQTLRDDIAYCQRSLRNFIKVHQMLVAKLVIGQTNDESIKIKGYLNEIDSEITEIGYEQKGLFQKVTELLNAHLTELNDDLIEVDKEIAYGCVSRVLSNHYEAQFNSKMPPQELTERLTEQELLEKYELTSFEDFIRNEREETFANLIKSAVSVKQASVLKTTNGQNHRTYNNSSKSNTKSVLNQIVQRHTKDITTGPLALGPMLNTIEPLRPTPKPKSSNPIQTVAIKSSRINLLQALAKAKDKKAQVSQQDLEEADNIENYIIEESLPLNSNASEEIGMEETMEMLDEAITDEQ